jgi:hypothetical protein
MSLQRDGMTDYCLAGETVWYSWRTGSLDEVQMRVDAGSVWKHSLEIAAERQKQISLLPPARRRIGGDPVRLELRRFPVILNHHLSRSWPGLPTTSTIPTKRIQIGPRRGRTLVHRLVRSYQYCAFWRRFLPDYDEGAARDYGRTSNLLKSEKSLFIGCRAHA